jgi:hypothetical protein
MAEIVGKVRMEAGDEWCVDIILDVHQVTFGYMNFNRSFRRCLFSWSFDFQATSRSL